MRVTSGVVGLDSFCASADCVILPTTSGLESHDISLESQTVQVRAATGGPSYEDVSLNMGRAGPGRTANAESAGIDHFILLTLPNDMQVLAKIKKTGKQVNSGEVVGQGPRDV